MRYPLGLMLLLATLLIQSCATILEGDVKRVRVYAPEGTQAYDSNGTRLKIATDKPGVYELELSEEREHRIRFEYEECSRNLRFRSSLQAGWVTLDAFLAYPLLVDAITGDWHGFEDIELVAPQAHRSDTSLANGLNPAIQQLQKDGTAKTSSLSKYAAAIAGNIIGVSLPVLARFTLVDWDYALLDPIIIVMILGTAPAFSAAGVALVAEGEHGNYWAAYGGHLLGQLASTTSAALLYIKHPLSAAIAISAYLIIPPVFSVMFYDNSRPRQYSLCRDPRSSGALLYLDGNSGTFSAGLPQPELHLNPWQQDKLIPGFSVLRIGL